MERRKYIGEFLLRAQNFGTPVWPKYITVNPEICHGKPCIRGMRWPVGIAGYGR
ncbi:MAG: DUF433 domain-containing protein [Saprospirales bacterium]|nr:DUF433 domain-containing protein [Saprospirales bacterium]